MERTRKRNGRLQELYKVFLRDGLELDPNDMKLVDAHRLHQRVKKAGNMKTRPIIFKVSTVFDKDIIYENMSKLENYHNDRASTVFITEHLPKLFYKQK